MDGDAAANLAFMRSTLPGIANASLPGGGRARQHLQRYAWFATRTDQSDSSPQKNAALMYETSARNLTALGVYYNSTEA